MLLSGYLKWYVGAAVLEPVFAIHYLLIHHLNKVESYLSFSKEP